MGAPYQAGLFLAPHRAIQTSAAGPKMKVVTKGFQVFRYGEEVNRARKGEAAAGSWLGGAGRKTTLENRSALAAEISEPGCGERGEGVVRK